VRWDTPFLVWLYSVFCGNRIQCKTFLAISTPTTY
jgi:hypothetical protein